jgi:adenine-specific DNA-methyltransferase
MNSTPSPMVDQLVTTCREYVEGLRKFEGKPEEETKQFLVEPFLQHLLQWSQITDDDYFEREFKGKVKDREWKDIVLLTEKRPRIFVETKACTDVNIDRKYAKDLLAYLKDYNADKTESEWVTWGILTNFTNTYFYHWSEPVSRPTSFLTFSYQELPARLDEIRELMTPEGVRNNRLLNKYLESPAHKLDDDFLQDLKKWRKIIANGFFKKSPSISLDQISELSHVFLSRLIFIRRLEATGVLQPHWLRNQYEAWRAGKTLLTPTFSDYLRELIKGFYRIYDTELFEEQACDTYPFEDSYFKDLLKYIDAPSAEVRLIAGIEELQDRGLYGYKFGELTLDVLGAAYERYLAHRLSVIEVNHRKIVAIEETAELRQKEGAYYTPTHIVKFILSRTLEPKLKTIFESASTLLSKHDFEGAKSKIRQMAVIKVLDPATGSGSFLIQAFEKIVSYYKLYNAQVAKEFQTFPYPQNRTADFQINRISERVLLENIYGVDLDPKAVEMTKLNLWLHHIDHNLNFYQYKGGAAKRRLLPSLDLNIQVGNSLIEGDGSGLGGFSKELARIRDLRKRLVEVRTEISQNEDDMQVDQLQKEEEVAKDELNQIILRVESTINEALKEYADSEDVAQPFNWTVRFPEVFANGGFDVYVGNPPYINLYRFTAGFRSYLSKRDAGIFNSKNDLLYHFYKRGVELLREEGRLGYITSRYFLEAENADLLRGFLSSQRIRSLVDYGNVELFRGINTRCVVQVLEKGTRSTGSPVDVGKVRRWNSAHQELTTLIDQHLGEVFSSADNMVSVFTMKSEVFGEAPWRLLSPEEVAFREGIEREAWRLGDTEEGEGLCDIGMGMQTGLNEAFTVTTDQMEEEHLEKKVVRKLVKNGDIRKYFMHQSDLHVIFSPAIDDITRYPNIRRHLMKYRDKLVQRYPCKGPKPTKKWFEYTVENMRDAFESPEKIIVPYRAPGSRFALETSGAIGTFDTYVIVPKENCPVNIMYLLALLNSSLLDYAYVQFYGRRKKAEFEYFTELMSRIPIRRPPHRTEHALTGLATDLTKLHQLRLALLETFNKDLSAVAGKLQTTLKHYYDYTEPYAIVDRQRLIGTDSVFKVGAPLIPVRRIGVEETGNCLVVEAELPQSQASERRKKVLQIEVMDLEIRRFLLYSTKLFIAKTFGKKTVGAEIDPLDAVLKHVDICRFRENAMENAEAIRNFMKAFASRTHFSSSISDLEREIWKKSQQIDEIVYSLYEVNVKDSDFLRDVYRCNTLSEFVDGLEEYSGVEEAM